MQNKNISYSTNKKHWEKIVCSNKKCPTQIEVQYNINVKVNKIIKNIRIIKLESYI